MLHIDAKPIDLKLTTPFRISRGDRGGVWRRQEIFSHQPDQVERSFARHQPAGFGLG